MYKNRNFSDKKILSKKWYYFLQGCNTVFLFVLLSKNEDKCHTKVAKNP